LGGNIAIYLLLSRLIRYSQHLFTIKLDYFLRVEIAYSDKKLCQASSVHD